MDGNAKGALDSVAPMGIYPCRPGGPNDYVYIFNSHNSPEHWRRLAVVIGRPELADDPEYFDRDKRASHNAEVDEIVAVWTRRHTKHEAMRLVGAAGVPAGAVLDTGDLLNEPSFETRGILQTMQHPNGTLKMPTFPVRFDGAPPPVKPSPLLGQHNTQVFGEWLGMSAGDIDTLNREGVV